MALTNNDIIKKLRVALKLRDDDIVEISNNNINKNWNQLINVLEKNVRQTNYINHQHFEYLLKNPPSNVRRNIIKLVKKDLEDLGITYDELIGNKKRKTTITYLQWFAPEIA